MPDARLAADARPAGRQRSRSSAGDDADVARNDRRRPGAFQPARQSPAIPRRSPRARARHDSIAEFLDTVASHACANAQPSVGRSATTVHMCCLHRNPVPATNLAPRGARVTAGGARFRRRSRSIESAGMNRIAAEPIRRHNAFTIACETTGMQPLGGTDRQAEIPFETPADTTPDRRPHCRRAIRNRSSDQPERPRTDRTMTASRICARRAGNPHTSRHVESHHGR